MAVPALVGALASVIVAILSAQFTARHQQRGADDAERRLIRETYLNPLRFHTVENYFRLADTLPRIEAGGGRFAELAVLDRPEEIAGKPVRWFAGDGIRLTSAAYLAACLFAHIARVRENVPYLSLSKTADTRLGALLLRVHVGFLKDRGIPYAAQTSIGHDLWHREERRLLSFREFCELLGDPKYAPWLERLVGFYVDLGNGRRIPQVRLLIEALEELAGFVDGHVGGGHSVETRVGIERATRDRYEELRGS